MNNKLSDLCAKFRVDLLRDYLWSMRKDHEIRHPDVQPIEEMQIDEFVGTINHLLTIIEMYKGHIERAYQILTLNNVGKINHFIEHYCDYIKQDVERAKKITERNKNANTGAKRGRKPKIS